MAILSYILLGIATLIIYSIVKQIYTFFSLKRKFYLVKRKNASQPSYVPGPANLVIWKAILKRLIFGKSKHTHTADWMQYEIVEPTGCQKPTEQGGTGLCHIAFGTKSFLVVSDPDLAKQVFLNSQVYPKMDPTTFQGNSTFSEFLGNDNVLFAEGELWKKLRTILNPAFYRVERYYDVFFDKTMHTFDVIGRMEKSGEVPIKTYDWMKRFTIDVLGATLLGYDFKSLDNSKDKYLEAYSELFATSSLPFFVRFLPFLKKYYKNPENAKNEALAEELINILIEQSKKKVEKYQKEGVDASEYSLLETLVSNPDLSRKEIRDNVLIMLIAGHETTANALTHQFYALAKFPHIQDKLVAEIDELIGQDNKPEPEKLHELRYLNAFILESLRRYNPVGVVTPKIVQKDVELGGYHVPKGTLINVFVHGLHRSEAVWGDPLAFRPERFIEKQTKQQQNAFTPFTLGPRTCIGNSFSLLEQKLFLVKLLQKYEVRLPDPNYEMIIDASNTITYCADPSFEIKLVRRTNIPQK